MFEKTNYENYIVTSKTNPNLVGEIINVEYIGMMSPLCYITVKWNNGTTSEHLEEDLIIKPAKDIINILRAKDDKSLVFCHYKTEHKHKNRYMCCILSNGTPVKFKNLRLEDFEVVKSYKFQTVSGKKYFACKKGVFSYYGNLVTDQTVINKIRRF